MLNLFKLTVSIFSLVLCLQQNGLAQQIENISLNGNPNSVSNIVVWSGQVLSAANDEAIIGAVITDGEDNNTVTDVDGNFSLDLGIGNYSLSFSALGFTDRVYVINALSSDNTVIRLDVENVIIDEVVIGAESGYQALTNITPGLQRLDAEQLETQSKFFGEIDILRSLQSISGVSNTGEGASGFNVRGGNSDQNLILQDGHLIFNPSHALGFFSLFHPDLVQYVDLYKGGIPAKYGGRLSSVLSVETRQGSKEKFKLKGGIGMVSSRLTLEGPIVKDKVSFIVGSRYSYADWIFGLVDNPDLAQSKAFFNDITVNVNGRLSQTTNVGISLLRSEDDFQLGDETRFDYSTLSGEAYLKQLIGSNMNFTLRANKGQYQSSLYDLKGNDQSKFTNTIDYTRAGADLLYVISDNNKLNLGAELNIYDVSPGEVEPIGTESIIAADQLPKEKGQEIAFYIEDQIKIGDKLDVSVGARYTTFKNVGPRDVFIYPEGVIKTERNIEGTESFSSGETIASYSGLEPRVSLKYALSDEASFKLGYAKTYQYLAQISNTASATPIDIWQLSNRYVEPQFSDNFSIGLFKNFTENTYQTSLELFYRETDGIIDYKDFARLLLNDHVETELVAGIGKAYGVEVNFNKRTGSFTWDANYTFSRSERQVVASAEQEGVNNGAWYPSNYDIPNVFNLNMVKRFGTKSNLSLNFTYRSGRPTTAPVSSYTNDNVLNIPIYSDRNAFRVPDFHRLDVAYTIGPFSKMASRWEHSITLSVYNLYSRRNAYSVYFRQNPFESVKAIRVATLGTIFPSITYNFSLK